MAWPGSPQVLRSLVLSLAASALLGGCAVPRMIDSTVSSYTGQAPARSNASFEFERLPSQTQSPRQDAIEALATEALRKVGLVPARSPDASGQAVGAHYKVQVSVHISQIANPAAPRPRSSLLWGLGDMQPIGSGTVLLLEPPWYRHAVQLVLRDSQSSQVAYETTAVFDGPWSDSTRLLPAIMDAALQGYPQAGGGARKVVVELPATPENR